MIEQLILHFFYFLLVYQILYVPTNKESRGLRSGDVGDKCYGNFDCYINQVSEDGDTSIDILG